jgi:hypothetical protein
LPPGTAECTAAIERLEPAADADTRPRLGGVCPEVAAALDEGMWGEALAGSGAGGLSTDAFLALVGVAERYADGDRSAEAPPHAELDAIVAGLRPFEPEPVQSLWERALAWFREWLGEGTGGAGDRFLEWLRDISLPESWTRTIIYAIAIALAALVLLIVINELRVAGVFSRSATRRPLAARPLSASQRPQALTWDALQATSPLEQPTLLLAMLLERLRKRNPGRVRDSFTHRELVAADIGLSALETDALHTVVTAAERVTFGAWVPAEHELEPVLVAGRSLMTSLDGTLAENA